MPQLEDKPDSDYIKIWEGKQGAEDLKIDETETAELTLRILNLQALKEKTNLQNQVYTSYQSVGLTVYNKGGI